MKTILVPLDGTIFGEQALPTAVSLARRTGATLELMLVNETNPGAGLERWPWAISSADTHTDYIAEQARRLRHTTDLVVEYSVANGRSADQICRYADAHDVDLIVMTSRCPTGLARVLGGSVADAVVRHSRTPVLLTHPPPPGRRIRHVTIRPDRVLVALDGSDEALAALESAIAISDRGATEIHLVEIVRPVKQPIRGPGRGRLDTHATARLMDGANTQLEALASAIADRTGCDVFPHVHADVDVAHGIRHVARGFNVSLIAMGSHGRGASRLLVGSVVERLLRDGRFPMLLVRAPNKRLHDDDVHSRAVGVDHV